MAGDRPAIEWVNFPLWRRSLPPRAPRPFFGVRECEGLGVLGLGCGRMGLVVVCSTEASGRKFVLYLWHSAHVQPQAQNAYRRVPPYGEPKARYPGALGRLGEMLFEPPPGREKNSCVGNAGDGSALGN